MRSHGGNPTGRVVVSPIAVTPITVLFRPQVRAITFARHRPSAALTGGDFHGLSRLYYPANRFLCTIGRYSGSGRNIF